MADVLHHILSFFLPSTQLPPVLLRLFPSTNLQITTTTTDFHLPSCCPFTPSTHLQQSSPWIHNHIRRTHNHIRRTQNHKRRTFNGLLSLLPSFVQQRFQGMEIY